MAVTDVTLLRNSSYHSIVQEMCNGLVVDMLCSYDFFLIWMAIGKMRLWIVYSFSFVYFVGKNGSARVHSHPHPLHKQIGERKKRVALTECAVRKWNSIHCKRTAFNTKGVCYRINHKFLLRVALICHRSLMSEYIYYSWLQIFIYPFWKWYEKI